MTGERYEIATAMIVKATIKRQRFIDLWLQSNKCVLHRVSKGTVVVQDTGCTPASTNAANRRGSQPSTPPKRLKWGFGGIPPPGWGNVRATNVQVRKGGVGTNGSHQTNSPGEGMCKYRARLGPGGYALKAGDNEGMKPKREKPARLSASAEICTAATAFGDVQNLM